MSGPNSGGHVKLNPQCRLYVGSLSPQATQTGIEDIFSKFGKILEVRLNRNFAFVQFSEEIEAKAAIAELNGQIHFGRKIDVQFAKAPRSMQDKGPDNNSRDRSPISRDGMDSGMRGGRGGGVGGGRSSGPAFGGGRGGVSDSFGSGPRDNSGGFGRDSGGDSFRGNDFQDMSFGQRDEPFGNRGDSYRDNSSAGGFGGGGGGGGGRDFRGSDNFRGGFRGGGGSNRSFGGQSWGDNNFRDEEFPRAGGSGGSDYRGNDFRDKGGFGQDRFPPRDNYRSPAFRNEKDGPDAWGPPDSNPWGNDPEIPPAKPAPVLNTPASERINDIEIIVMNKTLTDYGEFIEGKLKTLGFTVDLMFPNESAPLSRVLGNIASRGTLYAVVVTQMHKNNRSMTLDILHGTPTEHRNMLVEDALVFLNRDYESYSKALQAKKPDTSVPEQIRHLMETKLSGIKELTTIQYDILIQFLIQEKMKVEPPTAPEAALPVNQQAELQTRILSILNKNSAGGTATGNSSQTSAPQNATPEKKMERTNDEAQSPLLKDPSVQRALDSLMQGGNLFNKFNSPNPNPTWQSSPGKRF